MNLKTLVREELWLAISNSYESENYKNAIVDAMHHLTDVIRERSGLDGDGAALIGKAIGGKSPKLQINKLETESERDQQKGFGQILRGLYLGIRNPRSHEKTEDTRETADAVIHFIDYLLAILAESKPPFTIEDFLTRVLDPDFVRSERYAELLADEIPSKKLGESLIEIFRRKMDGNGYNLFYMVREILSRVGEQERRDFLAAVSDELRTTQQNRSIIRTLQLLPVELWPSLDEAARIRIENKVIQSIKDGRRDRLGETNREGVLGTWAHEYLGFYTLKQEAAEALIRKLESRNSSHRHYVAGFFLSELPRVLTHIYDIDRCMNAIAEAIKDGDTYMRDQLMQHTFSLPSVWKEKISGQLETLKTSDPDLLFRLENEIPF